MIETQTTHVIQLGNFGNAVKSEVQRLEIVHIVEVRERSEVILLDSQLPEVCEALKRIGLKISYSVLVEDKFPQFGASRKALNPGNLISLQEQDLELLEPSELEIANVNDVVVPKLENFEVSKPIQRLPGRRMVRGRGGRVSLNRDAALALT